jgi:hypothetical protein
MYTRCLLFPLMRSVLIEMSSSGLKRVNQSTLNAKRMAKEERNNGKKDGIVVASSME